MLGGETKKKVVGFSNELACAKELQIFHRQGHPWPKTPWT